MDIYVVKISEISEEILNYLYILIDSEKKNIIKKYFNKRDKIRTLIGEILIRTIIIQELKINNNNIKFSRNQYGKPYLENYPEFNFNISHSGEYVLCVWDNKFIGIDIEEIKPIECDKIAKNFFTKKEIAYILNQDVEIQLNKFYEIWTLKESYIKCCGQGMSIPLNSFSIEVDQYKHIKVFSNNEYGEHTFKLLDVDLGYKASICSLNKEISNNITRLEQNTLIDKYISFNLC